MRPLLRTTIPYTPRRNSALRTTTTLTDEPRRLSFRPVTPADIPAISAILADSGFRTNDFSIGGIYMWADYFSYTFCIVDDTLFIKGVTEDDITRPAFSLPVGKMSLARSITMLRDYCRDNSLKLVLSAVPAEAVDRLNDIADITAEELTDWGDYIYDATALATLAGKKYNKKRNHVNRFIADNPGYTFTPLTADNLADVIAFYDTMAVDPSKPVTADFERIQVMDVLRNLDRYPFEGAVLSVPDRGVVAFTIGELIGDTLYVHIEKMAHDVAGAGETVNKLFAEMMTTRHPGLRIINREEDTGDEGLRYAKMSYRPLDILRKYNVTIR